MDIANPDTGRKRVLLVEDHEDTLEMLSFKLREYNLTFARNFDEGLRLARKKDFALYILDNWLPGGSGIDLCRLIREFDPSTPILFYSAAAHAYEKEAAMSSGAQAYLVKPVSLDDLAREVARLASTVSDRGSVA
jgi:DNA-binding response OmpR family regulator